MEDLGEPLARGDPVAALGPVLGGVDREDGPVQPRCEAGEEPIALLGGQRTGGSDVERELDSGVGGVDALAAGPGRPREALDEIGGGNDQTRVQPGTGCHAEVVHHQ